MNALMANQVYLNVNWLEGILNWASERFIPHRIQFFVHGSAFEQQTTALLEFDVWVARAALIHRR